MNEVLLSPSKISTRDTRSASQLVAAASTLAYRSLVDGFHRAGVLDDHLDADAADDDEMRPSLLGSTFVQDEIFRDLDMPLHHRHRTFGISVFQPVDDGFVLLCGFEHSVRPASNV